MAQQYGPKIGSQNLLKFPLYYPSFPLLKKKNMTDQDLCQNPAMSSPIQEQKQRTRIRHKIPQYLPLFKNKTTDQDLTQNPQNVSPIQEQKSPNTAPYSEQKRRTRICPKFHWIKTEQNRVCLIFLYAKHLLMEIPSVFISEKVLSCAIANRIGP